MFADVASELVELTDGELDAFIREQELLRRQTEAKLAAAIAAADARALNEADGHRSMRTYLMATLDWSPGEIRRFRAAARTTDAHGEIGEAWMLGRLGSAQVEALSSTRRKRAAAERFAEFVPTFVEQGEALPLADFTTVLRRFVCLAEADDVHDEREAIERRSATVVDAGGELFLRASGGTALEAAEFAEIMRRFEHDEFQKDLAAHDAATAAGQTPDPFRSGPQRRFDALLRMARAAASSDGAIAPSTPLVSVLVDQSTMSWVLAHSGLGATETLDGRDVDPFTGLPCAAGDLGELLGSTDDLLDRRCETTTGVPLRVTDLLRAMLSGEIRRVVLGAKGRVVDMGRASRVFTGAARDAARLLTVCCDHPGCDVPAGWCQIDHSTEWHEAGTTDQDNAGVDCAHHNRDKHRHRRRTRRAANGRMYTFRADGTIMLPVGCRPPRFDDDASDCSDPGDEPDGEVSPAEVRRVTALARARIDALVAERSLAS